MSAQKLTSDIIEAAIAGFEVQRRRIDEQIADLRQALKGGAASSTSPAEPGKKRGISAAGREAIAEAQRRRWALARKAAGGDAKPAAPKAKRRLSAAGRKRIVEATKKRWALVRAQKAAAEGSAKPGKRTAAASAAEA